MERLVSEYEWQFRKGDQNVLSLSVGEERLVPREPSIRGRIERVEVSADLRAYAFDLEVSESPLRARFATSDDPDWLFLTTSVLGAGDYQFFDAPTFAFDSLRTLVLRPSKVEARSVLTPGLRLRSMGIGVRLDRLEGLVGRSAPPELAGLLRARVERSLGAAFATTRPMRRLASLALSSPLRGQARRLELEGFAIQMLAHVVAELHDRAAPRVRGLTRPERMSVFEAAERLAVFARLDDERPPSIGELASQVGLCGARLVEGFRLLFGTTVEEWLQEHRLAVWREHPGGRPNGRQAPASTGRAIELSSEPPRARGARAGRRSRAWIARACARRSWSCSASTPPSGATLGVAELCAGLGLESERAVPALRRSGGNPRTVPAGASPGPSRGAAARHCDADRPRRARCRVRQRGAFQSLVPLEVRALACSVSRDRAIAAIEVGSFLLDQRGVARPVDGDGANGAACDVGAVEVGQFLSISDVVAAEGSGGATTFQFTVPRPVASGTVQVDAAVASGTAQLGSDVLALASPTVTLLDGQSSVTVDVTVVADLAVEPEEAFFVVLSSPSNGYALADAQGQGTILDDDSATLTIAGVSAAEGDAGTTPFAFVVTLDAAVQGGLRLLYATSNGTAISGSDYTAISGSLAFAGSAGEEQTITVQVRGETTIELDETFTVVLSGVTDLAAGIDPSAISTSGSATGTVLDDDAPTLSIADVVLAEGDAGSQLATFTVTLSGTVAGGLTVAVDTSGGDATASSDYDALSTTLTFTGSDGEEQTASVTIHGDTVVEPDETFTVTLSSPQGSFPAGEVRLADAQAIGTIENDDAEVAPQPTSALEGSGGGTTAFSVAVTVTGDLLVPVPVDVSTVAGTASAGDDFQPLATTLTFQPGGPTTQNVVVLVIADDVVEGDETFGVRVSPPAPVRGAVTSAVVERTAPGGPQRAVSFGGEAEITIQGDDQDQAVQLAATKTVAGEPLPGSIVTYEVTLVNLGPGIAEDDPSSDELVDVLPPELELLGATADVGLAEADLATNTVRWNGELAPSQQVIVEIEAGIRADLSSGTMIPNQASALYDADNDGERESEARSDDPDTPAVEDATLLVVGAAIPTLGGAALLALAALLVLVALRLTGPRSG